MPELTVLLPAHNAAATLRSALGSTLRALPPDSELTVLDDASTDATPEILDSIGDPRLRVLRRETSTGLASGLNLLLESTDSRYVARMDADDVVLPWRLSTQLRILRRARYDVTFTAVAMLRGRRIQPTMPLGLSASEFPLHLLLTNPVAHPAMAATRRALEQVGGFRDVPSEDYDLWLRMATAGLRLGKTALPGLLYRIHDKQITASQQWRRTSWENPKIAAAYGDLSESILGVRFPRLLTLVSDPEVGQARVDDHIAELTAALERAGRALTPVARWYLRRTMAVRIAHARQVRAAGGGTTGNSHQEHS